jgi:hypothetical protein
MLITDISIIQEICILKERGLTMKKISHQLSRTHPNYFKEKRASLNFVPSDILKVFEELRASGELPKREGRFR